MSGMLPIQQTVYTKKRDSAAGRRYRSKIAPQNGTGTYQAGNTIIINIPTAANMMLIPSESTLNFRLNATAAGADVTYARFDSGSAHSMIARVRLYHGANILEDCDNYGQLAKILYDFSVPTDKAAGALSVAGGTRSDMYALSSYVDASLSNLRTTDINRITPVRYANSGASLISATLANGSTVSNRFSINLISLLGSLSNGKYLPLFAASASPLRCEIQLVSNLNQACAVSGAMTYTMDEVEYVGEFLQLSDEAINMILAESSSPLQFMCPAWANYQFTNANVTAGTSISQIPVAAKYSSLKSLVTAIRNVAAGNGVNTFYPHGSSHFGLSQAQWRIGSQIAPSNPLTTIEEYFSETMKVFGSMADLTHQPAIDRETYFIDASGIILAAAAGEPGQLGTGSSKLGSPGFAVGIDLEVFAGASRDAMLQGANTLTDDIYVTLTHNNTTGATLNLRYDTFACFDKNVVFENGSCYVRF